MTFLRTGVCALSLLLAPVAATAAVMAIDVTGTQSFDGFGSPNNAVLSADLGAGSAITGVGWDVTLTAFDPSWLSELRFSVSAEGMESAFFVFPSTTNASGTDTYSSPVLSLSGFAIADVLLPTGIVELEFYENFDDAPGAVDGRWDSGTVTLQYTPAAIPLPAGMALLLGGLTGLGGIRLRRARRQPSIT